MHPRSLVSLCIMRQLHNKIILQPDSCSCYVRNHILAQYVATTESQYDNSVLVIRHI